MSTLKVNQITDLNDAERFNITSGTAVASTSGTSIDFTGIPAWVKKITVMLSAVSTNGTSVPIIQLGDSGGIEITGYESCGGRPNGNTRSTIGLILLLDTQASWSTTGNYVISLQNPSTNNWVGGGTFMSESINLTQYSAGRKALSDTLDRLRITTINGTDTFDAGTINILYE
jgi:hypothetical protein